MKIVICGAGIAGLALAQRLGTAGHEVVVLERAPGPRTQGYMIDFYGPGYDAAEAMDVLPRIEELGYHVDTASYYDERGRKRAELSFQRFASAVGGRLVSVMRPDLERALRESLPADVELRFRACVEKVVDDGAGVRVTLADGTGIDADLLVGADGVHSTVRAQAFGSEERYLRYLGMHTAAFVFTDAEVHSAVLDEFCLSDTAGAEMGFYGLRDGSVAVFTIHRTPDPTLPADARAAVRRAYGGLGWLVPRALAACPPSGEVYYDQVAQIDMPHWSRGRVVLVGDACAAVSLIAGQGASLGIAGAYLLAEQLERAGSVEAALAAYERIWRPVTLEKQRVARGSARWMLPESRTQLRVRRAALRLSGLPGVDRYLARTLSGKPVSVVSAVEGTS